MHRYVGILMKEPLLPQLNLQTMSDGVTHGTLQVVHLLVGQRTIHRPVCDAEAETVSTAPGMYKGVQQLHLRSESGRARAQGGISRTYLDEDFIKYP